MIQATGTIRLAFLYPLVALIVPSLALLFVSPAQAEADAKAYAVRYGTAPGKSSADAAEEAGEGGPGAPVKEEAEVAETTPGTPAPLPSRILR